MSTSETTILLVEEEDDERSFLATHLEAAGFAVVAVEETGQARAMLTDGAAIAALVTDAHVPGPLDGHALAALARARRPDVLVVMTSGHSDETSGPLPEGAVFVSKPYLTTRLVPALREGLAKS